MGEKVFWLKPLYQLGFLRFFNFYFWIGVETIINGEYKKRIEQLRLMAKDATHDAGNPFFRMLQIMEHMRE
jgi:hypothetical protein